MHKVPVGGVSVVPPGGKTATTPPRVALTVQYHPQVNVPAYAILLAESIAVIFPARTTNARWIPTVDPAAVVFMIPTAIIAPAVGTAEEAAVGVVPAVESVTISSETKYVMSRLPTLPQPAPR